MIGKRMYVYFKELKLIIGHNNQAKLFPKGWYSRHKGRLFISSIVITSKCRKIWYRA